MKHSDTICFCVPIRLGTLLISSTIFVIYLVLTILTFTKKQVLEHWMTFQQSVDTSLTTEAFLGVFYSFAICFLVYVVVSVFGLASITLQRRRMVRLYHVLNWFFVLLLFTVSVAFWIYFKVKRNVYINDCQDIQNIKNNSTFNTYYTQIPVPGKQLIAPGSDKSLCITLITNWVIGTGIFVFVFNFLQVKKKDVICF
ncbi:unnamed protein product [Rhizopus stolonifer]